MELKTPSALKIEHDELHSDLKRVMASGGATAEAAREVARLLHGHFIKEEQFAIPPLGLLLPLSHSEIAVEMADTAKLAERLEAEMPDMLAEHAAIVAALDKLIDAARKERKPEAEEFAGKLKLHAQTEEQVSYPAAILAGKFVKEKLPLAA